MDRLPLLAAAALGSAILAAPHVQATAAAAGAGPSPWASPAAAAPSGGAGERLFRVADLSLGDTLKAAIAAGAANSYSQDAPQAAPVSAEPAPAAAPPVPAPVVSAPAPSAKVESPVTAVQPAATAAPRMAAEPRAEEAPAAHVAKPSPKHRHATRKPAHRAVAERAEPIPAKRKAAPELAKAASKPTEPERAAPPATVAPDLAKVAPKPAAPELAKAVPATLKSSTTADEAALPSPAPAVQARFSDADVDTVRPRTIDALPSPPEDVAAIPAVVAPDAREGKAPAAGPTRVATLESGIAGRTGAKPALTLSFAPGSTTLSRQSNDTLQQFARTFAARPGRLEITAYANSGDGSAAGARRLSLKRALAVRAVLLDQGVAATRMDVRALGGSGGVNGDPNRLELTVEGAPRGAAPNGRAGGG